MARQEERDPRQRAGQAFRLDVGGVVVNIRNESSARFAFEPESPEYVNFEKTLGASSAKTSADIDITIKNDEKSARKKQPPLFTGTESWSMYRAGQGYEFVLQPAALEKPLWRAQSNPDFSQITLLLNSKLFKACQPGPLPAQPVRYPLDQILLIHHLACRQGAIVHSAGLRFQGKSYIFPGVSGAGKSTLTRSIMAEKRFEPLSDDRMIIRWRAGDGDVGGNDHDGAEPDNAAGNDTSCNFTGDITENITTARCHAYGTPWPGDAGIAENENAPLAGILFLNKAPRNTLKRISPKQAFEKLMPVTSITWYHKELLLKLLDLCEKVVSEVPAYDLYFTPGAELGDFLIPQLKALVPSPAITGRTTLL